MPLLRVENLSKQFRSHWTYRRIPALSNVSFEVAPGDLFGFLGHNGAGKTTTIKCILGLLRKDSGAIVYDGMQLPSSRARESIGYLPELPYFYDHLTVQETLEFFSVLIRKRTSSEERRKSVLEITERVGLTDRLSSPVRALSKGLQQRLGLAQAILYKPKLLLLDEPFSGLDPLGRMEFRKIILDLNREGTTIMLSSHILSDVQSICNRVSILVKGELRKVFSLSEIREAYGDAFVVVLTHPERNPDFVEGLRTRAKETTEELSHQGTRIQFVFGTYDEATLALHQLLHLPASTQPVLEDFQVRAPSLEEIFVHVTKGVSLGGGR